MPREEDIVNQGGDLDFDNLFYLTGLDDCLFDVSKYASMFLQIGDQDVWHNHSSDERNISFCGGLTRVWNEGRT